MFKRMDVNDIKLSPELEKDLLSRENEDVEIDDQYEEDDTHGLSIGDELALEREEAEKIARGETDEPKEKDDDKEFNEDGFNEDGFDKEGFNKEGFDKEGFNSDGKDSEGNEKAEDEVEYDKDGFDPDGFNKDGFNADDKTKDGREKKDFTEGYDKDGYDVHGYDKDGKDIDGKEKIDPNEESPKKEQPSNEDVIDFKKVIDGEQEVKIKTEDGKEVQLKDILTDYANDTKWKKANTEKDQAVAKGRKELETEKTEFDEKNGALGKVLKEIADKDFLEAIDDHFDTEDNPIRALLKAVKDSESSVATRNEQALKDEEKLIETQDDELKVQVDAIREADESYNDINKMQDLFALATELKVSLPVAYDLAQVPLLKAEMEKNSEADKTTIKDLTKSKADIEKELKERNKEVAELKKNPKPNEPKHDKAIKGESAKKEVDNTPVSGFDEAEKKVRKLLGMDN